MPGRDFRRINKIATLLGQALRTNYLSPKCSMFYHRAFLGGDGPRLIGDSLLRFIQKT